MWACAINAVHGTERPVTVIAHPARLAVTQKPRLDALATFAVEPWEAWRRVVAVGPSPSVLTSFASGTVRATVAVFTSGVRTLAVDALAALTGERPVRTAPRGCKALARLRGRVEVAVTKAAGLGRARACHVLGTGHNGQKHENQFCCHIVDSAGNVQASKDGYQFEQDHVWCRWDKKTAHLLLQPEVRECLQEVSWRRYFGATAKYLATSGILIYSFVILIFSFVERAIQTIVVARYSAFKRLVYLYGAATVLKTCSCQTLCVIVWCLRAIDVITDHVYLNQMWSRFLEQNVNITLPPRPRPGPSTNYDHHYHNRGPLSVSLPFP